MLPAEAWGRVLCVLGKLSVSLGVQGPLIVTEELHSLSFESELQLNQSGLDIKLEVRPAACPLFMLRIKLELIEEIKPCCFLLSFFLFLGHFSARGRHLQRLPATQRLGLHPLVQHADHGAQSENTL